MLLGQDKKVFLTYQWMSAWQGEIGFKFLKFSCTLFPAMPKNIHIVLSLHTKLIVNWDINWFFLCTESLNKLDFLSWQIFSFNLNTNSTLVGRQKVPYKIPRNCPCRQTPFFKCCMLMISRDGPPFCLLHIDGGPPLGTNSNSKTNRWCLSSQITYQFNPLAPSPLESIWLSQTLKISFYNQRVF